MKKSFLFFLVMLCSNIVLQAQQVDNTLTPTQCVQQVFLGQGITVSNVQFQGDSTRQIGKFYGFSTFGIDSGIVLSTGDATGVVGAASGFATAQIQATNNVPFDQDITDVVQTNNPGISANDAAILEFDFIPQGDTIQFEYVFGSEEYPEFVCDYNDGFGMFLSGPGINGPFQNNANNIALIAGTTIPVSIYNINGGDSNSNCAWENSNDSLYIDNAANTELIFDGITTVLRAKAIVQCGQTYHLKIAIADAGDRAYDSGVMLKAKSLTSNLVVLEAATGNGDTSMVEGCMPGVFRFIRPSTSNVDTLVVPITIGGTAINGTDYAQIPDTIVFLPGIDTVTINIFPVVDGIVEVPESIIIGIQQLSCSGTVFNVITSTLWIIPAAPIVVSCPGPTICLNDSVTLSPNVTGGYPPYSFLWSTGATTSSINVSPNDTTSYWVLVTDTCTGGADTGFVRVDVIDPPNVTVGFSVSQVIEQCGVATLTFTLSPSQQSVYSVNTLVTGTANPTLDYTPAIPSTITFPPGITSLSFTVNAVSDVFPEGNENIIVSVNNANSCANSVSTDTLTISDNYVAPSIVLSSINTPTCPGDTVHLQADVLNGSGNFDFVWQNAGSNNNLNTNYYIAGGSGQVYVTVIDSVCGATTSTDIDSIAKIPVALIPIVIQTSSPAALQCPGFQASLTASATGGNGALSYVWNPGNISGSTVTVTPNATTTYTVTVSSQCNNSNTADVTVTVNPLQPVNIATISNITNICPNTPNLITPVVTQTGNTTFTYLWSPGNSSSPTATFSPQQTTNYLLLVGGQCNQTDTAQFTINVPVYPTITVDGGTDRTVACAGNAVDLIALSTGGGPSVRYSFSGGPYQSANNKIYFAAADTIVVITARDTCGNTARDSVKINVPVYPPLDITVSSDTAACNGTRGAFAVNITGGAVGLGYDIIWSTGTGTDSVLVATLDTGSVIVTDSKRYRVRVKDLCSTFDTASVYIRVKPCDVDIPNVFTPNGDNVNNRFIIKGLKEYPNTIVSIYDRWGRQVFLTQNYSDDTAWDGEGADAGTYFYLVEFVNKNITPRTGTLQLLR